MAKDNKGKWISHIPPGRHPVDKAMASSTLFIWSQMMNNHCSNSFCQRASFRHHTYSLTQWVLAIIVHCLASNKDYKRPWPCLLGTLQEQLGWLIFPWGTTHVRFGFESSKHAAIAKCNARHHSTIGQETVVSYINMSTFHVISSWLSYSLLYGSFDFCLVPVWCV